MNEHGVILQIVYLDMGEKLVEMELSDTIYKTRKILMSFSRPPTFKLFMTVKVLYDVQSVENDENVERCLFLFYFVVQTFIYFFYISDTF